MKYTMLLHFVVVLSHSLFKFAGLDSSTSRESISHIMNSQKSFKVSLKNFLPLELCYEDLFHLLMPFSIA